MTDFEREALGRLGRIEAALDRFEKSGDELERRTRALEKSQWAMGGAGSLIAVLLAAFGIHSQFH